MSKKAHATYVAPSGPASPPFLPTAGELYWVESLLYAASDRAHRRPAVVLDVPGPPHSPIRIVTRTTDLRVRGTQHAAQPQWGLTAGVFSDLNLVKKNEWWGPRVTLIGVLDVVTMNAVRMRFE